MNRLMIVARLVEGAHEDAEALIANGPPFDPDDLGFHRHAAYLTAGEVVFLFEAPQVEWIVNDIVDDPIVAETFGPGGTSSRGHQGSLTSSSTGHATKGGSASGSASRRIRRREDHATRTPRWGRFTAKPDTPKAQLAVGGGTDYPACALIDQASKQPVANGARNLWVTETALTTALNTSYMADRLGLFGIVVGVALLLSGIGFIVLAFAALHRKQVAVHSI